MKLHPYMAASLLIAQLSKLWAEEAGEAEELAQLTQQPCSEVVRNGKGKGKGKGRRKGKDRSVPVLHSNSCNKLHTYCLAA